MELGLTCGPPSPLFLVSAHSKGLSFPEAASNSLHSSMHRPLGDAGHQSLGTHPAILAYLRRAIEL